MATKDFSKVQEKMIAQCLGWEVVAGSGAAACCPGDIISDAWLGECKTHVAPGHKIYFNKDVWAKIKEEAVVKRRFPVLFTDDGSQKSNRTWCLLHENRLDLEEFIPYPITKGVNKNISINHEDLMNLYREARRIAGNKSIALSTEWNGEKVVVMPLSEFAECVSEI